jgi:hypothetical protein
MPYPHGWVCLIRAGGGGCAHRVSILSSVGWVKAIEDNLTSAVVVDLESFPWP